MPRRLVLLPLLGAAACAGAPAPIPPAASPAPAAEAPPPEVDMSRLTWSPEEARRLLDKTLTVRLGPSLGDLTEGERTAVEALLRVGALMQRIYEDSRHHQAAEARAALGADAPVASTLYRLFQGPVATTLDNAREPFLPVDPEVPGKNVYPWGIEKAEVADWLAAHPEDRPALLGERTVVRRATAENLASDQAALARHPALDTLHPGLTGRLAALAAAPDPSALYAVPYAVAWADALVTAQGLLFEAAAAVEADDPELARYLRNRGRDLLTNDYESGDAAWVTGRFGRLNAQIGAYETYDDALFGVKAFHSLSLLVRNEAATRELQEGLGGLQGVEDALPYARPKRVRADIPVGVYEVVADFGQARGTNTATILPNDPLFSRRYGRTILLRQNVMTHPELFAIARRQWEAAVAPAHHGELAPEGGFHRTLWHEIGHYLGVDRTEDGRPLDQALAGWSDALEEMKSDLVSLFAHQRFHQAGRLDDDRLRAVQASGVLRTLQAHRPRPDQPYQIMQLAQFNWFLDRGLLAFEPDGRLRIDYAGYPEAVESLLREVLALQSAGDPEAAQAFFDRWTAWDEARHAPLAARMREAQGPQFRLVRYQALGE